MSSEPKYRGKLPFDIVESDVDTGYNKQVVSSTLQDIEIVNIHTDEYGHLEGSPLQGPFTEAWVGGHQHRHIALNTGTDNEQNRPEAFLIDLSPNKVKIVGPTHFDPLRPRAIYSRDNIAKSPLNIKNIKSDAQNIGNFSKNYEIVQTSGRNINQSLIQNNATASGVLTTKFINFISSSEEYALPNYTGSGKTIIVERFSAPGDKKESSRGALDRNGEEYSPNNSLITRNITVRQGLYPQLTQHAAQFTSGFHGVNRNGFKRLKDIQVLSIQNSQPIIGQNSVYLMLLHITSSIYDNFWVQHSIPATDLRYKWIADSNTNIDEDSLMQYQSFAGNYNLNAAFTDITFNTSSFVTSGSNLEFEVDNSFIGSIIKDKKSININTNTFSVSSPGISASFSELANSPFGFSSWKQIRTAEHPVAKSLRNQNIISLEGLKRKVIRNNITYSKRSDSVANFKEPALTNKFKPLTEIIKTKNSDENYKFIFTHQNNISTFANKTIVEKLQLQQTSSQEMYDTLLQFHTDPNILLNKQNPFSSLEKLAYSETVYPRETNTYLAQTRGRTAYILTQSGISRDGYDRQLGTQRVFWRDNLEDRKRSDEEFYNSMNYESLNIKLTSFSGLADAWNETLDPPAPNIAYQTGIDVYKTSLNSVKLFDNNLSNNHLYLGKALVDISWESGPFSDAKIITNIIDNGCNGELNGEVFFDYYYTSSNNPLNGQLTRVTDMSVLTQFDNQVPGTYTTLSSILDYAKKPKISYVAFIGGFESGDRNYQNNGSLFEPYDYEFFQYPPSGIVKSTLDSGLRYDIQSFGNKKPWFDSYDNYLEDIRSFAKDHSIIPEFKISSHISYYINDNTNNFRIKNSSFLEIDGIGQNYRSSQQPSLNTYDNNFINSYVVTDTDKASEYQADNANIKLNNIKFTISGVKKLLPYNGFYPQDRTVQLANLFNNFLNENVGGGYFKLNGNGNFTQLLVDLTQSSDLFAKNTVMPYFFAPGILYNTVKSGISVSFPSITASFNSLTPNVDGEYSISKEINITSLGVKASYLAVPINSSMPFEALIRPEQYIPKKTNLTSSMEINWDNTAAPIEDIFNSTVNNTLLNIKIDCNTKPDKVLNAGKYWKNTIPFGFIKKDKITNPSYSMAMSNFLAEIPRFFLKNGSMNIFRSSELGKWKPFEIGKKYYFDLKLKKSSDLVMIESYKSNNHVTGNTNLEKTFNGRYFGWPVSKTSEPRTEYDNLVVHNDPAYAPFTPPYFEGEAILRFELNASKTQYESVEDLLKEINLIDIFDELGRSIDNNSEAYKNKMSIEDCFDVRGIGVNPITTFSINNANSFQQTTDPKKQYWTISPKLETPVLDFSDQELFHSEGDYWTNSGYGRGMWSGYGKIPTGSKGITVEIAESFPLRTNFRTNRDNLPNTGSLLSQVGFTTETAKIGQLADKKTISEAIIAIPYTDRQISGVTTRVDDHNFFLINPDVFDRLKTKVETNSVEKETSITKMIRLMKEYVIPPNFDFLKYYKNPKNSVTMNRLLEGINPFVMYIFEFKHDLDQQDLADIWQGVMPKIATTAENDMVTFSHDLGEEELFNKNFEIPQNLRWMIFKVKKKAEWNYYAITENIGDDDRFKFYFANSQQAKTPEYSYNWPYDYFSLVELAKVDITYTFGKKED